MTNYQPSNPTIERLKTLFKRRVADGDLAYLGDHEGEGARVDVPGMEGYVYCHYRFGNKLGSPFPVLAADVAYVNSAGAPVYIGYGNSGELQLVEAHYKSLRQAGINTQVLNPLNQQSKWVYLWQITIGKALAIATSATASTRVTVKSFWHFVGDRFQVADTPLQADKPDLSSYIPIADEHLYATLWLDTYTNDFEVTTSTAQAMSSPLDYTDVQETVPGRPPDAVPVEAFYLANAQTTIQQNRQHVDLRQLLNMPVLLGFPQTLNTRERVWPGRTFVIPGDSSVGTGSITLETGARLLPVHKSAIAASAPTTGDDSADGYSVGSRWLDSSTGILYIATNVSVGAAVWLAVSSGGGSFAPDDATYILQVADGDLPNAQAMGALATGIVKNTTTTGVQSIAVAGTDYTSPAGTENLSNKTITASSLVATALSLLLGGFRAIFTHANTADRTYTLPDYNATLATLAGVETLTNKTLTTPTIGDFSNAQHNHSNAAGGGNITGAAFGTQTANTILAGPTSGGAANPTFRAQVVNDLPVPVRALGTLGAANTHVVVNSGGTGYTFRDGFRKKWEAFSSNDTWSIDSDAQIVEIICIGGGGGGGSGRRGAVSSNRFGGGGGGAGGITRKVYAASQLPSSPYTITVGTGGGGGAARATNDTSGANGTDGGASSFGTLVNAIGGRGGSGGTNSGAAAGGVGNTTVGPSFQVYGSNGGDGGTNAATTAAIPGAEGPGGGGGAGGISAANTAGSGAAGAGANAGYAAATTGGGGTAGVVNTAGNAGGAGTNGTTTGASPLIAGTGGGGGASNAGAGGNGGNGGGPGGGGGGGSGSSNGSNSGAGGTGADGIVIVITYRDS